MCVINTKNYCLKTYLEAGLVCLEKELSAGEK